MYDHLMPWPPWNCGDPIGLEGSLETQRVKREERMPALVELLPSEAKRKKEVRDNVEDVDDDQEA